MASKQEERDGEKTRWFQSPLSGAKRLWGDFVRREAGPNSRIAANVDRRFANWLFGNNSRTRSQPQNTRSTKLQNNSRTRSQPQNSRSAQHQNSRSTKFTGRAPGPGRAMQSPTDRPPGLTSQPRRSPAPGTEITGSTPNNGLTGLTASGSAPAQTATGVSGLAARTTPTTTPQPSARREVQARTNPGQKLEDRPMEGPAEAPYDTAVQKEAIGKLLQFATTGGQQRNDRTQAGERGYLNSKTLWAIAAHADAHGGVPNVGGLDPTAPDYHKVQGLPGAQLRQALEDPAVKQHFRRGTQDMNSLYTGAKNSQAAAAAKEPWRLSDMLNAMLEQETRQGPIPAGYSTPHVNLHEELTRGAQEHAERLVADDPKAARELQSALRVVGRMPNAPELASVANALNAEVGRALGREAELHQGPSRAAGAEL
jgi:hypothetical protein